MLVFSGVFYFIFAWFREQLCIIICPYGRLQGALIDENTVNIYYDTRLRILRFDEFEDGARTFLTINVLIHLLNGALLAAFLLAMAAGVKYHGLLYLPVFALALACMGGGWRS